ncbi:MAG: diguanylate cyclase [Dictyoglomaceae bacterium]|nr:diguanylate cyclase [Dictyoglomaceae bacterium]
MIKNNIRFIIFILILIFAFIISRINFLLFHIFIELYSIFIGAMIYLLSTFTYRLLENKYFTFLGISYLFVSLIDFVHTLVYKGMNVFPITSANYPTQLWIIARYTESLSLLLAPLFINKKFKVYKIYLVYMFIFLSSLLFVFYFKNFPACYIEGKGLTQFKIISEYIISIILLLAIYTHWKCREHFDHYVLNLLFFSILATIVSELFFTLYVGVFDFMNAMGHIFKLVSFYFIYLAFINTSLRSPYITLFYEFLKESEKFKDYIEYVGVIILILDKKGNVLLINKKGEEVLGYTKEKIQGKNWFDNFMPEDKGEELKKAYDDLVKGKTKLKEREYKFPLKTRDDLKIIKWNISPLFDERGKIIGFIVSGEDITESKKEEELLKFYATTDTLTGVVNKRIGFEILEKEFQISLLRKNPISLVFIDVDDLKFVNDTYGHEEGDNNLKIITNTIKENIREDDTLFRFGGDEFIIILPNCNKDRAKNIIEKILRNLKSREQELNKDYNLSFSYGISVFDPENSLDMNTLIKEADYEMYKMKQKKKGSNFTPPNTL